MSGARSEPGGTSGSDVRRAEEDGEERTVPGGAPDGLRAIDPDLALRPGRADPIALLVVWILRRSFLPLVLLGTVVALFVIGSTDVPVDLGSPAEFVAVLVSPWAGVAVAVAVRLLASVLAWLLALPLTEAARPTRYDGWVAARWARAGLDRLRLARAYRELRWTWPVRRRAAQRLGALGRRLQLADRLVTVATVVVLVGSVLVIAANPAAGG